MAIDYTKRVALASKKGVRDPLFSSPILAPLKQYGGVMFPYMPDIQYDVRSLWEEQPLTHTNYAPNIYQRTTNPKVSINGAKFTASTVEEAQYMVAVMHFFKTITKMHFGRNDGLRGSPPQVLEFNAYGPAIFQNVPVVVSSVNYRYPSDIDYVPVQTPIGQVVVPIVLEMTIDLMTQYNTGPVARNFNLSDFAAGKLAKQGYV